MKLHPIHTAFVHFPAALFPVDFIFGIIAQYQNEQQLAIAAYYCLMAGVIGGWVALITGLFDLFRYVVKMDDDAVKTGLTHATLQSLVVFAFTVILFLEYKNMLALSELPVILWVSKGVLILTMLAGNFFGGEIIFSHWHKVLPFKKDLTS